MNHNEQTNLIYEAYQNIVNEAAESKFKVGDHVGVGAHYGHDYSPIDTGTVTKVNKFGHHTVEFHNRKSTDDAFKPLVKQFDARGKSKDQYSDAMLMPKDQHDGLVKSTADKQERSRDLHKIQAHLDAHKLGTGHFAKLSKSAAAQMKELIDKHTGEEA